MKRFQVLTAALCAAVLLCGFIILHFRCDYENEMQFYILVVFYCLFTYLRGCEGEYIIFLENFILAQHSAGILFKYGRCS